MDINKYASNKLKELRNRKNLTQAQLGEDLGITQQQVARYENNLRQFKQDFLFQLADYFNVSINEFFPDTTSEKQHDNYKRILREKGLIDENDYINEENLNKLMQIVDMIDSLDKKKEN